MELLSDRAEVAHIGVPELHCERKSSQALEIARGQKVACFGAPDAKMQSETFQPPTER